MAQSITGSPESVFSEVTFKNFCLVQNFILGTVPNIFIETVFEIYIKYLT